MHFEYFQFSKLRLNPVLMSVQVQTNSGVPRQQVAAGNFIILTLGQ